MNEAKDTSHCHFPVNKNALSRLSEGHPKCSFAIPADSAGPVQGPGSNQLDIQN